MLRGERDMKKINTLLFPGLMVECCSLEVLEDDVWRCKKSVMKQMKLFLSTKHYTIKV